MMANWKSFSLSPNHRLRLFPLLLLFLAILLFILYITLYQHQPTLSTTSILPKFTPFRNTNPRTTCTTSLRESNNYFCDTPTNWDLRKQKFILQQLQQNSTREDHKEKAQHFWQYNYEPNFACMFEERIGNPGDGGKWVCDPGRLVDLYKGDGEEEVVEGKKCVVYSFGSGRKWGFEERVFERVGKWRWDEEQKKKVFDEGVKGCEIHTFDHTVGDVKSPEYVKFHKWGLGKVDDPERKLYSLERIIKELGHDDGKSNIEIFKIDIEGSEYDALEGYVGNGVLDKYGMRQILIELHLPKMMTDGRGRRLRWKKGGREKRGWYKVHAFFEGLYRDDWVVFHKEPNLLTSGSLVEYALLKMNWNGKGLLEEFVRENPEHEMVKRWKAELEKQDSGAWE